jgi:hypothetical protein
VLTFALFVVLAAPVGAGGNWLSYREPPSDRVGGGPDGGRNLGTWAIVGVGQEIVAYTGIYVPNERRLARYLDRTYYAWLTPERERFGRPLPAGAIRLAPFVVAPFASGNGATVRARFVVPEVPPGRYEVLICDDPCREQGFNEYVQGWLEIVEAPAQARLMMLARQRAEQVDQLRHELRTLEGRWLDATERLRAATAELRSAELGMTAARAEIERLRLQAVRAPERSAWPLVLAWGIALASLGVTLAVLAARRRPRFEIPDTIPDDLERLERVG